MAKKRRVMSRAAKELKAALEPQPSMTQAELAKRLRVSQQAVSAWVHGHSMPELPRMLEIERLLGIPVAAWAELAPRTPVRRTGTDG